MLFALSFDKLIFGHTPDIMSIVGCSLILSSAIVVALRRGSGDSQQQKEDSVISTSNNEEGRQSLTDDVEQSEDHERLPVQVVEMRALR